MGAVILSYCQGMSWERGSRQVQRVLLGGAGGWLAVVAWSGVAALWVGAFALGLVFVPFAAACTVGAVFLVRRVASAWRVGEVLMLGSLATWVFCTVLFWWLWGVGFDAADAFRPMPPVMALYEPSLWLGVASFVVFWGALVVGEIRKRGKPKASSTATA